ncbi:MAG: CAP domain-containing protein [bacterium]
MVITAILIGMILITMTCCMWGETMDLDSLEQEVFNSVNQYRLSRNLGGLQWSDLIAAQCRGHSSDMAANLQTISHAGFEQRMERLKNEINISSASENVAYNMGLNDPCSAAVTGWINSPGHRANMEGDYLLTGIGIAQDSGGGLYFTQIFIFPAKEVSFLKHDSLSRLIFNRIKKMRLSENLTAIKYDRILEDLCIRGCEMLMELQQINRNAYEDIIDEVADIYSFSGIAFNYLKFNAVENPDSVVISTWLNNDENNRNVKGDFNLTGIAALHDNVGNYVVLEIFLRRDTLLSP